MDLNDIKSYRAKKIDEFKQRQEKAIKLLKQAVDHYKHQVGASENEVILIPQKDLMFKLRVKIDEMTWERSIELQLDSNSEEGKVFAVIDDITEIDISKPDNQEFQKEINDRIIQSIEKEVAKFNRKIKVF